MYNLRWIMPLLLLSLLGTSTSVLAQKEKVLSVKLKSLEVIQPEKKGGDELYISVTEFPQGEIPTHYQIPTPPSHWLSKYANGVKDVVLWKKPMQQCEPLNLLISLVEEDHPFWQMEDLLGSIELKVTCVKGKAVEQWVIPNSKITSGSKNDFLFTGKQAKYRLKFKLEQLNETMEDVKKDLEKEKEMERENEEPAGLNPVL